ncbi:MAG: hypothetical protein HLUCCA08_11570 [Rhodobacteraceae bacterium HLUCCA08]|nr:MAG: hypothetical protein HLUCCA08_11570 [Rhodobacteraceae bacterium HLUCCA08]
MATSTEDLEAQLEKARKDIETLAAMAGDRARSFAREQAASAEDHLAALSDEARLIYDRAAEDGRQMRDRTEDRIRSNPLAATGIAFLAGAFLAMLLGRK